MTNVEPPAREVAIQAAIGRAYKEAEVAEPTVAGASRIVPLEALLAGQVLTHTERPGLTRGSAGAFLSESLARPVDILGPAADQLSGYVHAVPGRGWILINRDDPVTRRRFTIAHELGHYLLHALPSLEAGASIFSEVQPVGQRKDNEDELGEDGEVSILGSGAETSTERATWEVEANQFAAALLMPVALCKALVEILGPDCGELRKVLASRLASELLVSLQAMTYRLTDLGLGRGD